MTRIPDSSKFYTQLFFPHFLGRTLLGLYFVLVELSEKEVLSSSDGYGSHSYGCRTVGATTSTCRPIDINPEMPTQIHTPQLRLVVQRGDNVYLPCRVHNLGVNQVIWRHGNDIIAGSNLTSTSFPSMTERGELFPDFTLHLSRVRASDEGTYQCIVSPWPTITLTHTLKVLDPPTLNIEPDTGSVIVSEGDSVQIGCIPKGNPTPQITWSKRDGVIRLHPRELNQRRILIENVSARDSGVYICRADNRVGRPATGSIYVRVLHSPEIRTPKRRVHGGVRQRASLLCLAHGDPKPDVQWLFGQKPVLLSARVSAESRGNEYYLNFTSVREKDFGSYLCLGNNSLGYDMKHIEFSGVPNAPVVTRWETSACGQENVPIVVQDNPSSPCTVSVQLFWVVECYSSLIDYRLHFRSVTTDQPVTSANEDQAPPWTELTIPADSTSTPTFLHTKSYTIHGLPNNTIYEGAVRARNKFGWSFLSSVFYFTSVPNSSLKVNEIRQAFTNYPDNENWRKDPRIHNPSEDTQHPDYDDDEDETSSATHLIHPIVRVVILISFNTFLIYH